MPGGLTLGFAMHLFESKIKNLLWADKRRECVGCDSRESSVTTQKSVPRCHRGPAGHC